MQIQGYPSHEHESRMKGWGPPDPSTLVYEDVIFFPRPGSPRIYTKISVKCPCNSPIESITSRLSSTADCYENLMKQVTPAITTMNIYSLE